MDPESKSPDPKELQELMARSGPRLKAYVRLKAGPILLERESADDLVQSVYRDILENFDRFGHGGEKGMHRWLFKTAERKIADRYEYYGAQKRDIRRESRLPAAPFSDTGSVEDEEQLLACYRGFYTPSQQAEAREELARFEWGFAKLPPEQQEVVLRAKLLGESRREIAEALDKSEEAVRAQLYRALSVLAAHMDDL